MALPDKIDVQAGGWSKDGSPWVQVVLAGDPDSGEFSKDGSRWWGSKLTGLVWTAGILKYYTGGTWTAGILKYYTGEAWTVKSVITMI